MAAELEDDIDIIPPTQPTNRYLLTRLGIGNFNATLVITQMSIAPATTDPKSPGIILLVKAIQRRLNALGAKLTVTGYLNTDTATWLRKVVGQGWEQLPWGQNVSALLAASPFRITVGRRAPTGRMAQAAPDNVDTTLSGISDSITAHPFAWALGGVAAYLVITTGRRGPARFRR